VPIILLFASVRNYSFFVDALSFSRQGRQSLPSSLVRQASSAHRGIRHPINELCRHALVQVRCRAFVYFARRRGFPAGGEVLT